jgi:hypothetical protein
MAESNNDRSLETIGLLAEHLNAAMSRFRGPIDCDTVLADFARAVDLFLTMTTRAGLARDKQDAVLAAVHRLLGAERSCIRYSDRFIIACQILSHCARPQTVTCAEYATSAAAALEYVLYLSEPQLVAGMICDVAIGGQWRSPSGNVVVVNRMNLLPVILPMVDIEDGSDGIDASCASMSTDVSVSPRGVDRSYASHLGQLILTNEMLSVLPGNFRYVVTKSSAFSDLHAAVVESLYSNGRFVEQFAGISLSHVRRCAETLMGRDILLSVKDEVQLFDLLCSESVLPLLAAVGTVHGGIEWLAISSFIASQGRVCTFNPKEPGTLAKISLPQFASRIR